MREHKSLENILEHLDTKKYQVPVDWPFKEARRLFIEPEITDPATLEVNILSFIIIGIDINSFINRFNNICIITRMLFSENFV